MSAVTMRVVSADEPVFGQLARLWAAAYPVAGLRDAEALERYTEHARERDRDPGTRIVAVEREGSAVAVMAIYDLVMNARGRDVRTTGLGSVAVSLAHKRRGIARDMVRWHLDDGRAGGAAFSALYPFRPDFYRALGYGYGTPTYRFRFAPASLNADGARGTARLLALDDAGAIVACNARVRVRINGLMAVQPAWLRRMLEVPEVRYVGIDDGTGTLRAYAQTSVLLGPDGTANRNALLVRDVHYEDGPSLAALVAYLRDQRDQFAQIVLETQDEAAHLVARDPRDGSDALVAPPAVHRVAETGLGIMYRVLDVAQAFTHLGPVDTPFVLRVVVDDAFYEPTSGTWSFRFGRYAGPQHDDAAVADATLRIGIGELSSLVMGSLDLRALVRYGAASVEPDVLLERVDRAFRPDNRPICSTRF